MVVEAMSSENGLKTTNPRANNNFSYLLSGWLWIMLPHERE